MAAKNFSEALDFVKPINESWFKENISNLEGKIALSILPNHDKHPLNGKEKVELAIVGIPSPNEKNIAIPESTYNIRKELYYLESHMPNLQIADLGDVILSENPKDTLYAIREITTVLLRNKIKIILLGANQSYTVGNLWAFREFESDTNLVVIDQKTDLEEMKIDVTDNNWLNIAFHDSNSYLYNITLLGHQSYLTNKKQLNRFNTSYFDKFKLGSIRQQIESVEPVFRDADLVSFDISSIRCNDATAQSDPSPNGLYSEEACHLSRYAGLSDRLHSFGIYGYQHEKDQFHLTAKLIAQIVWYFIEGYFNRKHDYPETALEEYTKYVVALDEIDFPIVFYNSTKTDRWWIEVNTKKSEDDESGAKIVCACTLDDYKDACNNEIPEKWWNNFKKLR